MREHLNHQATLLLTGASAACKSSEVFAGFSAA